MYITHILGDPTEIRPIELHLSSAVFFIYNFPIIIKHMNNTERKIYFSVYCLTFTFYGCFLSALGPIIPFLAKEYNQPETSFTYLFTCRTVGMLIGAMLSRWLTDKLTYHCIILTAVLGSVMPFLIFPAVDWLMLRAVCLLVTAIFCAIF